jgi:hypothetical protein
MKGWAASFVTPLPFKEWWYSLNKGLGGPSSWFGHFAGKKNHFNSNKLTNQMKQFYKFIT